MLHLVYSCLSKGGKILQIDIYNAQRVNGGHTRLAALGAYFSIDPASESVTQSTEEQNRTFEATCEVGISGTLIAFHLNFWLSRTLTKRKK